MKDLKEGQVLEIMAEILRVKKDVPTVIKVNGHRYILDVGRDHMRVAKK